MIQFNPDTHTYMLDGKELISVTKLLKKHGLSSDYTSVPGRVLEAAAQKGTLIHKEIETWVKTGEYGFTPELDAFVDISEQVQMKDMISEAIVYNDICAGTIDIVCTMNSTVTGKTVRAIIDIKSTSVLNRESCRYQTSLYRSLYESRTGEKIDELYALHLRGSTGKLVSLLPVDSEVINELFECEIEGRIFNQSSDSLSLQNQMLTKIERAQAIITSINEQKKQAEAQLEKLKAVLISAMKKGGVKTFENDRLKITYIEPSIRIGIDAAKLKKDKPEIAKEYSKQTPVSEGVRITVKGDGYG
jgi:hypothetical protein